MKRRAVLGAGARGVLALGGAKALHNTVAGYGHVGIGNNLRTQDIPALAREHLRIPSSLEVSVYGWDVELAGRDVRYRDGRDAWQPAGAGPATVDRFARDIEALRSGSFRVTPTDPDTFFESLAGADVQPSLVTVLRGRNAPADDPAAVEAFAGTDPRAPEQLLWALVEAFRTYSHYDVPRYLAGSIDDNILPFDAGLRDPLRPDVGFDALLRADGSVGLFCVEYARLARAAVQSRRAPEQSPPLYGMLVRDRRHKHVYNAFGSVRRTPDGLALPMTFVDYTNSTRNDDFRLTGLLGTGLDAYDTLHRADVITW